MMYGSCVVCKRAEAPPDLHLKFCSRCQSALYCSKACQKIDWTKKHKKICKLLNVGRGDMQVRTPEHTNRSNEYKEAFESRELFINGIEDLKRFFKLFEESTFEGSQAAALEMKKIVERLSKHNQKFLLFHSLRYLVRSSDSEMLSWPNSPLLMMLQFVDPNVLSRDEHEPLPEGEAISTRSGGSFRLLDPQKPAHTSKAAY
jgi:hypothetical protein